MLFAAVAIHVSVAADTVDVASLARELADIESPAARSARTRLESSRYAGSVKQRLAEAADLLSRGTFTSAVEIELLLHLALSDSEADRARASEMAGPAPAASPPAPRKGAAVMPSMLKPAAESTEPTASADPATEPKPQPRPAPKGAVVMPSMMAPSKPSPSKPSPSPRPSSSPTPSPSPAPSTAPTSGDDAESEPSPPSRSKLLAYKKGRLYREYVDIHTTSVASTTIPAVGNSVPMTFTSVNTRSQLMYMPYKGDGTPLSPFRFYQEVGEKRRLHSHMQEQKALRNQGTGLLVGAAASLVLSMGAYVAGTGENVTYAQENASLLGGTGFLLASGGLSLGALALWGKRLQKDSFVTSTIPASVADDLIEAHNKKLRDSLGLSEEDVMDIDD